MKKHIANVVIETMEDITSSIKSYGDVHVSPHETTGVKIDAWPYIIKVTPSDSIYHWTLKSTEDPSDFDEGYSNDPLEDILESLSEGTPAGDMWKQFANMNPIELSIMLKKIAMIRNEKKKLMILKRISSILKISNEATIIYELHRKEINKIFKDAKNRKWNVELEEEPDELTYMTFNIHDIYKGAIRLIKTMYEYEFEVDGHPEATEKGLTDGVINALRQWVATKKVKSAVDKVSVNPGSLPGSLPGNSFDTTPVDTTLDVKTQKVPPKDLTDGWDYKPTIPFAEDYRPTTR